MGVVISTSSELAPISMASIVIGFISFAFTLGTFFKVVNTNIMTLSETQHTVHTYLNTLREELLEERASLRVLKRCNKQRRKTGKRLPDALATLLSVELDQVTIRTMSDSIRHLIRQFHELERPFLQDGEDGISQARRRSTTKRRGGRSPSSQYGDSRGRGEDGEEDDEDEDDDLYWAQRVKYGRYNLRRRLIWLVRKSDAQALYEQLSKMQTRRISRQVNSLTIMLRAYGDSTMSTQDALQRIEDRLGRVIGVRRID